MPFDSNPSNPATKLEYEIHALASDSDRQEALARFSPWKIYPGKKGGSRYALIHAESEKGHPDGGYFLANLVLQGGGILGVAHAGLIHGLEIAGFRFPGIAGTSAGAILAMGGFAARQGDLMAPMGQTVLDLINEAPMHEFVDGPRQIRRLIKTVAAGRSYYHPMFLYAAWLALKRLLAKRGLNHGHVFEQWTAEKLGALGIKTNHDLTEQMDALADDLHNATTEPADALPFGPKDPTEEGALKGEDLFKVISFAMPTGMKFKLPEDLKLLHAEYETLPAARLLRMSMSIPLFFEPVTMRTNPAAWEDHVGRSYANFVSDRVGTELKEIDALTFLDGGLFSNLPTDALVDHMSPDIGSISVPLVSNSKSVGFQRRNTPKALMSDAMSVFNAIRLQRDREAHDQYAKKPNNKHRVMKIDTGNVNWLNFNLPQDEREFLFLAGLERVRNALRDGEFYDEYL